jgi:hypothetical protein
MQPGNLKAREAKRHKREARGVKVVIPYVGELQGSDAQMVRLVEFLGIPYETLSLPTGTDVELLKKVVRDQASCLVVNPRVMEKWLGPDGISADMVSYLMACFQHLLVHGVRVDHPFDSAMVATLSGNRLQSVRAIDGTSRVYEFSSDSKDVCGAFSGISFGPANPANDHVFSVGASGPAIRSLISIGGSPFMAVLREGSTELLFVAGEDIAELNREVGDVPLAEYFSRLVPYAMALRYAAGDECWRPCKAHASIIIDDPLLRKNYGFLNFESLLRLADQHKFHSTIAFIPHNFRRNSSRITRMFHENAARLSICFHGNDHTEGEFASTDLAFLNTSLRIAESRMNLHYQMTGLPCDRVMVFPQGKFSIEAMKVLKSHNFYAAVNTVPHPEGQPVQLTIGELAQPAVLRYGGFPLFIRKSIQRTQSHDIAFNLLFGRPVLIVAHHEIFQRPERLVEIAARINSVAPEAHWSNLATVVGNSILTRRAPNGTHHVRAYSRTVRISNESGSIRRYSIEWGDSCDGASIEQVLMDGTPCCSFEIDDAGPRLSVELAPGSSQTFSLDHRNVYVTVRNLGLRWNALAFLRRRLSEFRDNYLSKNQRFLTAAKALQRRFLKV